MSVLILLQEKVDLLKQLSDKDITTEILKVSHPLSSTTTTLFIQLTFFSPLPFFSFSFFVVDVNCTNGEAVGER